MTTRVDQIYIRECANAWRLEYAQLQEFKKLVDKAQERVDEAKATLIMACDGNEYEGCFVKVSKSIVKGTVQYELIPQLKDVDIDIYRKESQERWIVKPSVME